MRKAGARALTAKSLSQAAGDTSATPARSVTAASEPPDRRRDDARRGALFGEIGEDEAALGAESPDFRRDGLAALLLTVAEDQGRRAGLSEIERDLPADALGGSGDQHSLTLHETGPSGGFDQGGAPRISAV
jgi:GNAT superfamily N-acetyltransferase